jgi:hypothetical protein
MIHFDAKHQKSEAKKKVKLSEKIEVKRKLREKNEKKTKKNEKKRKKGKIYLNFASLCFASKQKLRN